MSRNVFKDLCGKVDYSTYNIIQNILGCSSFGLTLSSIYIHNQCPILDVPIYSLYAATFVSYIIMNCSDGQYYTKEINEVKNLYHEFIKNYNKLNKIFNLNDPIQIYTMFQYLLYKGYLSQDKSFRLEETPEKDIPYLEGTNIITGKAVCRHISQTLTDIMIENGIEAYKLIMHYCHYDFDINIIDEKKYSKEELFKYIDIYVPDEKMRLIYKGLIDCILYETSNGVEIIPKLIDDKKTSKIKPGNHAITFTYKDGIVAFLDPTHQTIFKMSDSNPKVLYDQMGKHYIKMLRMAETKEIREFFRMKRRLKGDLTCLQKEEQQKLIDSTLNLCQENIDIFETFYTDNCGLYREIAHGVEKIKRRIV